MRLSIKAALPVALLTCTIWVLGCGGSGKSPSTGASASQVAARTPTKAAFVSQADAICERLKLAIVKGEEAIGGYTEPDRARISVVYASSEEKASNELSRISPPGGDERAWQRIVGLRRDLVGWHHKLTKYASRGEHERLEKTYTAYKVAQKKMLEGFQKSGFNFKLCASMG
jgi:hypothetical protein